jgi:hypothetical protein
MLIGKSGHANAAIAGKFHAAGQQGLGGGLRQGRSFPDRDQRRKIP